MKKLPLLLVLLSLLLILPAQADVTLPDDLTRIEAQAFLNDKSLTGALIIPEGVTEIGAQAFKGCTGLTSVTLPSTLQSIGSEAFAGCTGLKDTVEIPPDTSVKDDAFHGSDATIRQENPASDFTYTIAAGEVTITGYAGTEPIGKLVIPRMIDGYPVTAIGESAFQFNSSLTGLDLPQTITRLDFCAFYGCPNLSGNFFIEGTMHHSAFMGSPLAVGFSYTVNSDQTATITRYSSGQNEGVVTIPTYINNHLVTALGEEAMKSPKTLTMIVLPSGLKSIGRECFGGAEFGTMILPDTLECIADYAFYATTVSNLVLPENVKTIGDYAFAYSTLENLVLPENVKTIGNYAFAYSALESIIFPKHIDTLDYATLNGCKSLKSVTLPENITEIPMLMFSGCSALESITLPKNITYLGWRAFADTTSLTSINLDNITETHNSVFSGSKLLSDAAAKVVAQVVKPGMSDFKKAKALHDWVVNNTTYYLYVAGPEGTFFMDGGSCMSYTQAYGLLLDQVGIENLYIEAPAEMNHIWNLIKLDGEWYHVDCTWDDGGDILTYEYFCLSDELIKKDHSWPYANYPAANGTRYTNGVDHGN